MGFLLFPKGSLVTSEVFNSDVKMTPRIVKLTLYLFELTVYPFELTPRIVEMLVQYGYEVCVKCVVLFELGRYSVDLGR